jgi:Tol biopolymer transport system component
MKPNGHDLTQITFGDGVFELLDWSPDGTQITFTLDCQIGFVNADGSNYRVLPPEDPTTIPNENVCDGDSSFTPDGQHVVYNHYDARIDVEGFRTMRLDGTDRRVLFENACCDPNVSPDGTQISFHPGEGPLAVSNLDGSGFHLLSPADWNVGIKSDWAPDGSRIVFWNNRIPEPGDVTNVYTVRRDGTDLFQVTHFTKPDYFVAGTSWSADGQWLLFKLQIANAGTTDAGLNAFFRVRPDGTALKRISDWLDWTPRQVDWGPAAAH